MLALIDFSSNEPKAAGMMTRASADAKSGLVKPEESSASTGFAQVEFLDVATYWINQLKENFARTVEAAEETQARWAKTSLAGVNFAIGCTEKATELMQANAEMALEAGRKLAVAKSPSEIMQVAATWTSVQLQALRELSGDLGSLAGRLTLEMMNAAAEDAPARRLRFDPNQGRPPQRRTI